MAKAQTPRFSKATLDFLVKAGRQKKPDWLDRNREEYEEVLQRPIQNLAAHLKRELGKTATGYNFPQKGLARIKRSAAKAQEYGSHFKDWVTYSASRPRTSRFDHNPNIFFMINPDDEDGEEFLIAGGLYMPSSRQMRAIRESIAHDASAFEKLFASKEFKACFRGGFSDERKSSRIPRGFEATHPRMHWIQLQAFFVWRPYKKSEYTSPKFAEIVARDARQIVRLNELLDQAIGGRPAALKAKPDETRSRGLLTILDEIEAPRRKADF